MKSLVWGALPALFAMSSALALAQSPPAATPPAPPTYQSLLNQGYEIKSVLYLTDAETTRLAQKVTADSVLVTIEKGPSTATCWTTFASWQANNISAIPCNLLH